MYNAGSANSLKIYLIDELRRAQSERAPLERKWMEYNRIYRGEPLQARKTFPFDGASNLVVPMTSTDVDVTYARIMAMLFMPQNLFTCIPWRPDTVDFAKACQEFLQWAQDNELHLYDPIADFILELCKLGTGVTKTRYTREYKKVYEYRETQDPNGLKSMESHKRLLLKNHPSVHHVNLNDFYVPASCTNWPADAQWCAERIELSWAQMASRINTGIYAGDGVKNASASWALSSGSDYERSMQGLDRFKQSRPDRVELMEFWVDWDIDLDGEQEALVCTVHMPTQSYVRLDFNPFFNQEKPYDVARFLRQPKRFYGIGLAEMLWHLNEEVSTMHNQRIDNASVRNAQILVALKTGNIRQDEPIFPGRILLVDSMDEVKSMPMGQASANYTTIPDERITLEYASQRTGVNDYTAGGDSASVGYSTAGGAAQMLREGSKRFDQVLREVRMAISGTGTKIMELYQQFNQYGKTYLALGQEDGEYVNKVLNFPLELVRASIAIDVTATSSAYNKDMELRTNTIVMQQLTQYYMQLLQVMGIALNPQVPPQIRMLAQKAGDAGTLMMRRIIDGYGLRDADRMLPELQEALNAGQQQLSGLVGSLQTAGAGGQAMAPGNGAMPGMGTVPGISNAAQVAGLVGPGAGQQPGGGMQVAGQTGRF